MRSFETLGISFCVPESRESHLRWYRCASGTQRMSEFVLRICRFVANTKRGYHGGFWRRNKNERKIIVPQFVDWPSVRLIFGQTFSKQQWEGSVLLTLWIPGERDGNRDKLIFGVAWPKIELSGTDRHKERNRKPDEYREHTHTYTHTKHSLHWHERRKCFGTCYKLFWL